MADNLINWSSIISTYPLRTKWEDSLRTLSKAGRISSLTFLETAFLRMELVEHLAKIQLTAQQAGGVRRIPDQDVERLLVARTKAGLGAEARAAKNN